MTDNANIEIKPSSLNNKKISVITITIITIIIAGISLYLWYNHNTTFITPTTFDQEIPDSLINEVLIDTTFTDSLNTDSLDSISIDTIKVDSINIDSINNRSITSKGSFFDTSKKEIKDLLMSLEQYIEQTSQSFKDGRSSHQNAKIACDSVLNEIDKISKKKGAEDFKSQIKSITRKANKLKESLEQSESDKTNSEQ